MARASHCFLAYGFGRETITFKLFCQKNPQIQPNANPSALFGRERLVNLLIFLSYYPIFPPIHLKEAWAGGGFSLRQICHADRLCMKEGGAGTCGAGLETAVAAAFLRRFEGLAICLEA